MSKINPRIDIVFKKIFGVEENKDLLISLINSIVAPEDQVSEVVLLNPYNVKNLLDGKGSVLDIKASGNNGSLLEGANDKYLQKALHVLDVMSFTDEERDAYEGRVKWFQVEANTLKKAEERGIEIGEKRGIEIGEKRGVEIGEKRGIEIGEKRGVEIGKKREIESMVINLFKEKASLALMCRVSRLSPEEIQAILKTHSLSEAEML
jgi:predicted HTH domain antitoxin